MARLFPDDIPYLEETDKRKEKIILYWKPSWIIADLLKIFEKYLDSIQIYNKVVQGTPIPHHRVLFFIERISKGLYAKWHMFFKHLLKYYSLNEVGDLLYQGFSYAGLKKEYLRCYFTRWTLLPLASRQNSCKPLPPTTCHLSPWMKTGGLGQLKKKKTTTHSTTENIGSLHHMNHWPLVIFSLFNNI